MESVDIFYQIEGCREIQHLEVPAEHNFGTVKALLIEKHGLPAETILFLEDTDEPVDELIVVRERMGSHGVKAHLHRCRHVEVSVIFNGESVEHRFGPSATVARIKRWAAENKFGMTPEEAGEHVLQIAGTHDRPAPNTHVGALVAYPHCQVIFDLVPDQRVNGFYGDGQ
jgi:plasmid stabilization system protein ParE